MATDLNDDIVTQEAPPDTGADAPALENEEPTEVTPAEDDSAADLPESEDDVTPATTEPTESVPEAEEEPEIPDPAAEDLPASAEPPPVFLARDVSSAPADDEELSQEDAYQQLQSYMTDHNYGQDDFDTYSQDPQWQDLHQQAFPEHYTDAQQADSTQADVPQNAQGYELSREVPTADTEQSNDAAVLTEENPEFAQQHEDSRQRLCADAGKRPGRA